MKKTTVVIPNWNGKQYLKECLDSLLSQENTKLHIIIVDNGSTDGSVAFLEEHYPMVEVIAFSQNLGFCKAVNAGIQAAGTEYVFLLNNDTTVDKHCVASLETAIEKNSKIFSVGAKMLSMQNPEIIDDAGDYYCALGWAYATGKGKKDCEKYSKPKKIFAACAGAALYRKEIFDSIGLFDENHFAYLEDIDVGFRARIYGYFNVFEPAALVYHAGSATSGSKYNEFKINFSSRNSIYIIRKNIPLVGRLINLPFFVIGFFVKVLFFLKKGYAQVYIKGLFAGLKLSVTREGRSKKVVFRWKHFGNYCRIQLELWANIFRRFVNGG